MSDTLTCDWETVSMPDNDTAETYYDFIIGYLDDLSKVGAIHPRVALLGVASEIELLIKEIDPRSWTFKERDSYDSYRGFIGSYYTSVRDGLLRTRPQSKKFLELITEQGNQCRHSPVRVLESDVEWAVRRAKQFVSDLREMSVEFYCRKCSKRQPFRFRDVLDASPNTPWRCNACDAVHVWPDGEGEFEAPTLRLPR